MSSLYRKYRPGRFAEVVGQDHIRTNLIAALKKGSIGHAYLFHGPRGTGKTTLARLFAAAVNCPKRGKEAEACGVCEICREISRGQAVDIIEIDAASNRGIDEIRELRDKIGFAPTRTTYKVYIIDEVHMLTKEAFNALLKTLEEPPGHAIFILATTELHKVPETILSRCQRFSFHRATDQALTDVLARVAAAEKITLDPAALTIIVNRAEGSFRDSLTLLGSVMNVPGKLSADNIRSLLGLPQEAILERLYQAIIGARPDEVVATIDGVITEGGDPVVVVKALADRLKTNVIANRGESATEARLLEQLLLLMARVRQSSDPMALIIARLYDVARTQAVSPSVPVAEQIAAPAPSSPPAGGPPTVTDLQKSETAAEEPVAVDAVTAPKAEVADGFWGAFLEGIKDSNHALYAVLRSAELENLLDDKMVIAVKFRFYSERLLEAKNRKLIEKVAADVAGRPVLLECHVRADLKPPPSGEEDLVSTVVNVFEIQEN